MAAAPSMVEFRIPKRGGKAKNRITAVDFRRADLQLFRDLLRRVPWETVLESRGVQERWLIFKYRLPAKLKSGPSQQAGNQAKAAGGLHG